MPDYLYPRTGEFRKPKHGEWYESDGPSQAGVDFQNVAYWILRRVEATDSVEASAKRAGWLDPSAAAHRDGVAAGRRQALEEMRAWVEQRRDQHERGWGPHAGRMRRTGPRARRNHPQAGDEEMTEPTEINDIRESVPEVDKFFCNWKMCIPSCDLSSFQRDCAQNWLAGYAAAREQALRLNIEAEHMGPCCECVVATKIAISAMTPERQEGEG
jgi:hypothetical protein